MASQFDTRSKGAARVLTFGGVEAAVIEEKETKTRYDGATFIYNLN